MMQDGNSGEMVEREIEAYFPISEKINKFVENITDEQFESIVKTYKSSFDLTNEKIDIASSISKAAILFLRGYSSDTKTEQYLVEKTTEFKHLVSNLTSHIERINLLDTKHLLLISVKRYENGNFDYEFFNAN